MVRRIARAMLVEEARQRVDLGARAEALRALKRNRGPTRNTRAPGHGRREPGDCRDSGVARRPPCRGCPRLQLNQGGPGLVTTIDALGRSGSPRAIPALVARLKDPRQEVRAASLEALGQLGDADVVPHVTPLLADTNMRVRVTAAGALLQLGDSSGIPLLQGLMTDPDPSTRLLAAEALKSQPDGGWLAVVRELATSEDPKCAPGPPGCWALTTRRSPGRCSRAFQATTAPRFGAGGGEHERSHVNRPDDAAGNAEERVPPDARKGRSPGSGLDEIASSAVRQPDTDQCFTVDIARAHKYTA